MFKWEKNKVTNLKKNIIIKKIINATSMQYIKGKIKRNVNISGILRIFSIYKIVKIIKKNNWDPPPCSS